MLMLLLNRKIINIIIVNNILYFLEFVFKNKTVRNKENCEKKISFTTSCKY